MFSESWQLLKKHGYENLNQTASTEEIFFEVLDNQQRMRGFDPTLADVELGSHFCARLFEDSTNVRKSLNCSLRS